ncbi:hypothetical protein HanXRQr2_Chr06g0262751 [Helianthus annuus]|uniref:Uncharacterized protein n=1 Tax=Helianthus annuus TaxID=4232 RepID=A0A251UIP2_HELAN|nr:hypothetical protein HanXRQr2_Chr06g0262751 [Helianthus annuus]
MNVVYGGTSSMLGVFSSFTSFLGRPFLLWSPYLNWLLHVYDRMILDGVNPEKDRMMETT